MSDSDADTLDLFAPEVSQDRWHPNFKRIATEASPEERALLLEWARGFEDRDGKFVKELQTTFNSSFWELYLHALFRDAGCVRDQSRARPDFVVTDGPLGAFTAEAVIASNPEANSPEWTWDPTAPTAQRETILDLACLRLAQAILAKQQKWSAGYSSLEWCHDRPFVVCVGPFEQPWASLQGTEAIDRVLFRGPRPVLSTRDGIPVVVGHEVSDRVFKPSGAAVELGLFTDDRCAGISAVLFSSLATWSKVRAMSDPGKRLMSFFGSRLQDGMLVPFVATGGKYKEGIEEGAHLFVNPFASVPLNPQPFLDLGLGVHWFKSTGTLTAMPPQGLLLSRTAVEVRPQSEAVRPHERPAGATPHVASLPPDGVPFAGPSRGPITDQVTLELWRAWTLFIGRDMVDHDWAVIAKRVTVRSVSSFVDASPGTDGEFMTEFFPTRARAVDEARSRIDEAMDE